ncbi:divisome-associated lipoprotein DalA [Ovoidimarina sediminis]|uniref:CAP domain-containing protein n=1 Tax=Ovoidimarina sediminis TaxID=3079856 RepID=UPI00290C2A81|nr:CAP domain-containing protein [Rhodophyticola sp. MJ-SS7]MDU8942432.1 CAP domain-containing protein [Rhodophyticola sp. MJ-SS7]
MRIFLPYLVLSALAVLTACSPSEIRGPQIGPDGLPLPTVYKIRASDEDDIKIRMLDSVNALRRAAGVGEVTMDARLNAAAATHARDMALQNRPWHFGSNLASPIDRVARTGYDGYFVGEAISETYENETETLSAWMSEDYTRSLLLDSRATRMGFDWFQEENGKLWWTLVLGS